MQFIAGGAAGAAGDVSLDSTCLAQPPRKIGAIVGGERRANDRHDAAEESVVDTQAVDVGVRERVEVQGWHDVCEPVGGVTTWRDVAL